MKMPTPDASVLALATRCGDHLVGRAQRMPHGVGWIPERADAPLAGFAHGAAGMAWALLKLAAATGQPRFRAVALEAIAYERSLYSPDARNWPDLRPSPSSAQAAAGAWPSFMTAWCHGAPGIGLARLHSRELLDGAPVRAEIEAAMETTTARGLGGSHCLCHGDLGNVDLLLEARRLDGDRRWSTVIDHTAAGVLHDVERQRFLCGTPSGVESPGLMTGLAGIGYGLLRLARPGFVPSVLVLEPHRAGSAA